MIMVALQDVREHQVEWNAKLLRTMPKRETRRIRNDSVSNEGLPSGEELKFIAEIRARLDAEA